MIRAHIRLSQVQPRFLRVALSLILVFTILNVSEGAFAQSCPNVAGTWRVDSIVDARDCDEGIYRQDDIIFTVTQDGCNIDVANASMTYHGTVSVNEIQLNGVYPDGGGTTNETVTLTIEGNALSGSAFWSWSGLFGSCSGTTQISGTMEMDPIPPEGSSLKGMVKDASSGQPVARALITLSPGGYEVTSGTDGAFSISGLPPGIYLVQVSASGYVAKTLPHVTLLGSVSNQLNISLLPYAPQILDASAFPPQVGNDGRGTTLLSVRVVHPQGVSFISSVFGDLSSMGGSAQQTFNDQGTQGDVEAGDGIYSCRVTVAQGTKARLYALNVTAVDEVGNKGFGAISLHVTEKVTGIVGSGQSGSEVFENSLEGQDLRITIRLSGSQTVSGIRAIKSECQLQVTVSDPEGVQYGSYFVTDADEINISIPNAAEGQWEYEIVSHCGSALSYEIETSGAGTGMLVGRVMDGFSGSGIPGANIKCNTGGSTVSLEQGYFSGVAVAGTGQVITSRAGYQTNIKDGVLVTAGTTTSLNIQIVPQDPSGQAVPSGQNTYQLLDPSEDPNPPAQPFAAKVSGSNLEFNVLFPRYVQAVDLYLGFTISAPQHAGKLYLFNDHDDPVEFTGTLYAWRRGTTVSEGAQILISAASGSYALGDYTLYALVTTDSETLSNFDLSYFSTTLAKPPPSGQNATFISNPAADPNPMIQPLAAKLTGGNLVLNGRFPLQAQPVTIYLAYTTPSGDLFLFKQDHSQALFTGTLWPWRQEVTAEQSAQILSTPAFQWSPGTYYFYALVTTDPVSLSNFDLVYFAVGIGN